jgi:hypothetical protein
MKCCEYSSRFSKNWNIDIFTEQQFFQKVTKKNSVEFENLKKYFFFQKFPNLNSSILGQPVPRIAIYLSPNIF